MFHRLTTLLICCPFAAGMTAQTDVAALVDKYKADDRGPYRDIQWFCDDGSQISPRVGGCPYESENNYQHARYKREVIELGENESIYLGQILTNTDPTAFLDRADDFSRMKQYMLGEYLYNVDDGWVNRKAQYYRGAFQVEDEREWGRKFLNGLMGMEDLIKKEFYLVRQAVRYLPHRKENDRMTRVRADSKRLADAFGKFMKLRIKIHGQPEARDAAAVEAFLNEHREELEERGYVDDMKQLAADIRTAYETQDYVADIAQINQSIRETVADNDLKTAIAQFTEQQARREGDDRAVDRMTAASDLLWTIRTGLLHETPAWRLEVMDVSVALEQLIFSTAGQWQPTDARELTEKICYLAQAAAGAGYVETWEWEQTQPQLADMNYNSVWPHMVDDYLDAARRFVEWATSTNRATYGEVVERYAAFEPRAYGFLDDRIRGSLLLPLGNAVGALGNWAARAGNLNNALFDVPNQGNLRGLNPGYANGKLHVIEGSPDEIEVNPDDVYVFATPPADLKPVGGIATVSEGNMVSHVQLLARNLGIPNAVLTDEQFGALRQYDGDEVFYAVSNGGTIIMKPADEMDDTERALFSKKERNTNRITVPVNNIRLDVRRVLNLREVRSKDSGKICGPKAANLGQLKALFPAKVVEGLVIPFGIFRAHLDQPMPGQGTTSYWAFLNDRFAEGRRMEQAGHSEREIEAYTLAQLATLRQAITRMQIQPDLVNSLQREFRSVFGGTLGEVPVFLRSDTNMEDLADFTGAGLNKTVFNVVDEDKILDGIRAVWASPYTERSYKWRQRYLLNPENVFPSILIIPSVDVDNSGVMITKGVSSGRADDVTVAFSRGAGGAVDGQAAEAYLLRADRTTALLSPARERLHRRLPVTGGSTMVRAAFNERILSPQNLADLRQLAGEVERVMPEAPGVDAAGPWDVELGFRNDNIYLFQIRPFVENKQAQSSDYLESISPVVEEGVYYDLTTEL